MFACIHARGMEAGDARLLACAQVFSPVVERTTADAVTLDAAGLDRIFGLPQEVAAAIARQAAEAGFDATVALAANPDAAFRAARGFRGVHVIPQGDEGKYLAELPVALLDPSPELAETFESWGIRRFRDLAGLPEIGLAERLGAEGVRLQVLARGEGRRPLVPVGGPDEFAGELELEHPVELLEPLLFLLSRLLHDACARLAARGLAANELRLTLKLEDQSSHARILSLPVPMLDVKAFLKLLQLDLSAHPPRAPILRVRLEARPVEPRSAQSGLFVPLAPEPERLEITLARIAALAGERNVGAADLLDTHRPDAHAMRRFGALRLAGARQPEAGRRERILALRRIRPPRPARVRVAGGRPAWVYAGEVRGAVRDASGPWRASGDWWTRSAWYRDEWDVALSEGGVYRLYADSTGWFLEGVYD